MLTLLFCLYSFNYQHFSFIISCFHFTLLLFHFFIQCFSFLCQICSKLFPFTIIFFSSSFPCAQYRFLHYFFSLLPDSHFYFLHILIKSFSFPYAFCMNFIYFTYLHTQDFHFPHTQKTHFSLLFFSFAFLSSLFSLLLNITRAFTY